MPVKPLPLDIEAIRARLAKANPFGVPRWISADVTALLAEVERLRAEAEATRAASDDKTS